MKQSSIPQSNHSAHHHPDGAAKPDSGSAPQSGRGPDGRFCKGNPGGPGNPFARAVAALRQEFLKAVTSEDISGIARAMIQKAKEGDVAAAKVVLQYTLGKPAGTVDPDRLDEMEWQQWQREKVEGGADVLLGTTASSACALARVAIPFHQAAKFAQFGEDVQARREEARAEAARRERAAARRAERRARRAERKARRAEKQARAAERVEATPEEQTAAVPAWPEAVEMPTGGESAREVSPMESQKAEEGGQTATVEGWNTALAKVLGMMGVTVNKRPETARRAANDFEDGERRHAPPRR
jgi:hypothetical protein